MTEECQNGSEENKLALMSPTFDTGCKGKTPT